jgi:hypothetical protein
MHYRVYVLNEQGQFMGAVNLVCTDDETAKEHASRLADGHEVELWRLVARFKFDNPRSRPAATQRRRVLGPGFSHFRKPLKRTYFTWMRCASCRVQSLKNVIPIQAGDRTACRCSRGCAR